MSNSMISKYKEPKLTEIQVKIDNPTGTEEHFNRRFLWLLEKRLPFKSVIIYRSEQHE